MSEAVVTLDLREHLNAGRDPFSVIMNAVSHLGAGEKLLLVVPFEPVPLYGVMASRGFDFESKERSDGNWEILFSPGGKPSEFSGNPPVCERAPKSGIIEVDARGLEPPEPMVKILETVAGLPPGAEAHVFTDRRPVHLYPQLEERGLDGESREQPDGSYLTVIRHR